MATTFEVLSNLKCSPWRFIPFETQVVGDDTFHFYGPRSYLKTDYEDNITVQYDGNYNLPILAYKMYKNAFGEDAVRLYWVILEFSGLESMMDVVIGTKLTFPSPNKIKQIIK